MGSKGPSSLSTLGLRLKNGLHVHMDNKRGPPLRWAPAPHHVNPALLDGDKLRNSRKSRKAMFSKLNSSLVGDPKEAFSNLSIYLPPLVKQPVVWFLHFWSTGISSLTCRLWESGQGAMIERSGFNPRPRHLVASLDKTPCDAFLCLVELKHAVNCPDKT